MIKRIYFLLPLFLLTALVYSQHERVQLGEVCYVEYIDGITTSSIVRPYTYHERIELKFDSGYQISIKEDKKEVLLKLLKQYSYFHEKSMSEENNSLQIIGSFSPETVNKSRKVIDAKASIDIIYSLGLSEIPDSKGNLVLKIPDLVDMFGTENAPMHYIFIPSKCVDDLLSCLSK